MEGAHLNKRGDLDVAGSREAVDAATLRAELHQGGVVGLDDVALAQEPPAHRGLFALTGVGQVGKDAGIVERLCRVVLALGSQRSSSRLNLDAHRLIWVYPGRMADIGGMLRAARVELGLGQAELAARAATTQTYVSRVERGVTEPSLSTLERLFHAMGLRLQITPEPIPLGNVSAEELRRDFLESTPQERISQVMTLSAFVTGVAAQAQERRARGTS